MEQAGGQVDPGSDRLERFRALRARLDPAGNPADARAEGLYLRPPKSVGSRLAAEFALAPASTHLVIGGVGSGKTTEVLEAGDQINQIPDMQAIYVDVTKRHDIGTFVSGAVAVQVGLAFADRLRSIGQDHEDAKYLLNLANGYWEDPPFPGDETMGEHDPRTDS